MELSARRLFVAAAVLAGLSVSAFGFQDPSTHRTPPFAQEDDADRQDPIDLGHGYERRGDHVYFAGQRIDEAGRRELPRFERVLGYRVTPASAVDAATFEVLSPEYTKDAKKVYFKHISPNWYCVVEMTKADPATFEVLDLHLAKDARSVWWNDRPLPNADPATAVVVSEGMVWKDAKTVYYQSQALDDADPKTFRHYAHSFHGDATRVYWGTDLLPGADPATFRTFGEVPYAVDMNRVWVAKEPHEELDPASFRLHANHVFSDENGVYVSPKANAVRGADVASFEKVGPVGELGCALFRDEDSLFVFESAYYLEMYGIEKEGDAIVVSKDLWMPRIDGKRIRAAHVRATWNGSEFSEPVVTVEPGFKRTISAKLEVEKFELFSGSFREAIELTKFGREKE